MGTEPLDHEQHREDDDADRQDGVGEVGLGDLESFHGREHRDGRRDQGVAVEQ